MWSLCSSSYLPPFPLLLGDTLLLLFNTLFHKLHFECPSFSPSQICSCLKPLSFFFCSHVNKYVNFSLSLSSICFLPLSSPLTPLCVWCLRPTLCILPHQKLPINHSQPIQFVHVNKIKLIRKRTARDQQITLTGGTLLPPSVPRPIYLSTHPFFPYTAAVASARVWSRTEMAELMACVHDQSE